MSLDIWILAAVGVIWLAFGPVASFFRTNTERRKRSRNYGRVTSRARRQLAIFSVKTSGA